MVIIASSSDYLPFCDKCHKGSNINIDINGILYSIRAHQNDDKVSLLLYGPAGVLHLTSINLKDTYVYATLPDFHDITGGHFYGSGYITLLIVEMAGQVYSLFFQKDYSIAVLSKSKTYLDGFSFNAIASDYEVMIVYKKNPAIRLMIFYYYDDKHITIYDESKEITFIKREQKYYLTLLIENTRYYVETPFDNFVNIVDSLPILFDTLKEKVYLFSLIDKELFNIRMALHCLL